MSLIRKRKRTGGGSEREKTSLNIKKKDEETPGEWRRGGGREKRQISAQKMILPYWVKVFFTDFSFYTITFALQC